MNLHFKTQIVWHLLLLSQLALSPLAHSNDIEKLITAMKNETPIITDLRQLTDEIGGRLTGTKANEQSIEWALNKFKDAGVKVKTESFLMPRAWIEQSASAQISGLNGLEFKTNIVAMPFTQSTPFKGTTAEIINLKQGSRENFAQIKNLFA